VGSSRDQSRESLGSKSKKKRKKEDKKKEKT